VSTKHNRLIKYFDDLEITRDEAVNLLKNLLFTCTFGELQKLEKDREVPIGLRLLFKALLRDFENGRCDTMNSIIDFVF